MFRRSKHIAVFVSQAKFDAAVEFYVQAFGMSVEEKSSSSASLKGGNFMLYVEVSSPSGLDLQEFVPESEADAERQLLGLGCELIEVNGSTHSTDGFYVRDPYGLRYHVFTSDRPID